MFLTSETSTAADWLTNIKYNQNLKLKPNINCMVYNSFKFLNWKTLMQSTNNEFNSYWASKAGLEQILCKSFNFVLTPSMNLEIKHSWLQDSESQTLLICLQD